MSEEMIVNGLAVIGAGTCLYGLVRVLAAVFRWAQTPVEEPAAAPAKAPAAAAPLAPDAIARDDIAVIAAAVHAMLESHRIVHIESDESSFTWSAEGRWLHQTSHRTH